MADEANQGNGNQGQESGAGNQGQGQESASQQGQQGNQSGQQSQGQESGNANQQQGQQEQVPDFASMSEADLRTYAAKLHKDAGEARREAANYRTQHQQAQSKLTEAERAQMSEQERREADLTAAQAKLTESETRISELEKTVEDLTKGNAIRQALAQAGALNAATAFKVGSWDDVKLDEDGTVNGESFAKALADLRKSDDYLFKRGASADAGAGTGQAPEAGSSINDMIRGGRGR